MSNIGKTVHDLMYQVSKKGCMIEDRCVSYFSGDIILERTDIRDSLTNELLISLFKLSGNGFDDTYWVE